MRGRSPSGIGEVRSRARNRMSASARAISRWVSTGEAGLVALVVVAVWFVTGLATGFPEIWFAVLFTVTGGSTFILLFVLQHASARDLRAALLKLDELIAATGAARNVLQRAEHRTLSEQEQLERLVVEDPPPDPGGLFEVVRESRPDIDELPVVDDMRELTRLVAERGDIYLRYSKGPTTDAASGPSQDYESGLTMSGLSVTTIGPEPWWNRPAADWIARRICKYAELGEEEDRFPWLLAGRKVGHGPDHEPLIVDVVPVARVGRRALEQAKRRYGERFTVGQDSRPSRHGTPEPEPDRNEAPEPEAGRNGTPEPEASRNGDAGPGRPGRSDRAGHP